MTICGVKYQTKTAGMLMGVRFTQVPDQFPVICS